MAMDLRFEECRGGEITARICELGRLRIAVFREYPYLYDGDEEAEMGYLRSYAAAAGSYVCLACDGGEAVGATTCVPMTEAEEAFRKPFADAGWDLARICYFGESVLLPEYRGHGVGREFFRRREAEATRLGLPVTTFCAVDRPPDHPARPAGYRPLATRADRNSRRSFHGRKPARPAKPSTRSRSGRRGRVPPQGMRLKSRADESKSRPTHGRFMERRSMSADAHGKSISGASAHLIASSWTSANTFRRSWR
jgi:GNAT superfamily N-acetyltransferase